MLKKEEIDKLIKIDKNSKIKRRARVGQRYYDAEHDIINYKIYYFNADDELVEDTSRSNIKISHPFFTELVDQEVQFLLSKFEIKAKKETDKILDDELKNRFNEEFKSELSDTCEGTISKGWSYMYGYLAKDNKTRFKNADCLGVIEVRKEETSDNAEYIIYYYVDRIDKKNNLIVKIEVWDASYRYFFVKVGNGAIEVDKNEKINPRPHKVYKKNNELVYRPSEPGYEKIPFFRLNNNKKSVSALKPIKKLIDDYDLMSCGLSNNLQDVSDAIYVVKGFPGNDLDKLQHNLKNKKIIGVGDNGDVDIRTIDVPYEARKTKMEIDEQNIYKFGMGFNSNQIGDGNITNVVIKSRYTLLVLKCNKLKKYLKAFLSELIEIELEEINRDNNTNYTINDVDISIEYEIPTSETDDATVKKTEAETKQIYVDILLSAASKLDDETIIKELCEVLDLDYEEIKDKIEINKIDLNQASETLDNVQNEVVTEDGQITG